MPSNPQILKILNAKPQGCLGAASDRATTDRASATMCQARFLNPPASRNRPIIPSSEPQNFPHPGTRPVTFSLLPSPLAAAPLMRLDRTTPFGESKFASEHERFNQISEVPDSLRQRTAVGQRPVRSVDAAVPCSVSGRICASSCLPASNRLQWGNVCGHPGA